MTVIRRPTVSERVLSPRPVIGWAVVTSLAGTLVGGWPGTALVQVAMLPVLVLVLATFWARPPRNVQLLAGAALALWLADVAWDLLGVTRHAGGPSAADALYLAGYALVVTGLTRRREIDGGARLREGTIDGLLLAVPVTVICWRLAVVPALEGSGSVLARLVLAAYPVADAVLLAAILWALASRDAARRPLLAVLAGTATLLVADAACALASTSWSDDALRLVDAAQPVAFACIALGARAAARAAADPGGRSAPAAPQIPPGATAPEPVAGSAPGVVAAATAHSAGPRARIALLAIAVLAAPATMVIRPAGDDRALVAGATLVAAVLVAVRMAQLFLRLERTTADLAQASDELAEHGRRDALTGLLNRSAIGGLLALSGADDAAGPRLGEPKDAHAEPTSDVATVLAIDLDGFKAVNDRHGHAAGDALLRAIARRLEAAVRAADSVVRVGGDEFLVVCHGLEEGDAHRMAGELRHHIEQPVAWQGIHLAVSASIGVAAVAGAATTTDRLLHEADLAMYLAKRSGTGVERYDGPDAPTPPADGGRIADRRDAGTGSLPTEAPDPLPLGHEVRP